MKHNYERLKDHILPLSDAETFSLARDYLVSKGCSSNHIDEQINRINNIENYV